MSKDVYLSDTAKLSLVDALAGEVIKQGEAEASIISSTSLTDDEAEVLIKSNTFLTTFAVFLLEIVERKDAQLAKAVLDVWTSETIQELVQYAFEDEIAQAQQALADDIDTLELFINQHTPNTNK